MTLPVGVASLPPISLVVDSTGDDVALVAISSGIADAPLVVPSFTPLPPAVESPSVPALVVGSSLVVPSVVDVLASPRVARALGVGCVDDDFSWQKAV